VLTGVTPADDQEVTAAKRVIFDPASTASGREEALTVLRGRGAARPNEVSLVRQAVELAVAAAVVFGVFALLVLLF
jgi:hypothetical protein